MESIYLIKSLLQKRFNSNFGSKRCLSTYSNKEGMSKSSCSNRWQDLPLPARRATYLRTVTIPENFHQSSGWSISPLETPVHLDRAIFGQSTPYGPLREGASSGSGYNTTPNPAQTILFGLQHSIQRSEDCASGREDIQAETEDVLPSIQSQLHSEGSNVSIGSGKKGRTFTKGYIGYYPSHPYWPQMPAVGVGDPISTLAGPKASGPQRKKFSNWKELTAILSFTSL